MLLEKAGNYGMFKGVSTPQFFGVLLQERTGQKTALRQHDPRWLHVPGDGIPREEGRTVQRSLHTPV